MASSNAINGANRSQLKANRAFNMHVNQDIHITHTLRTPPGQSLKFLEVSGFSESRFLFLVLLECIALAQEYKQKTIRVKCCRSSKDWRAFCLAQLTKSVGARILHRYSNWHAIAQPVPLFKPGSKANTPTQAVELDAQHWKRFWQRPTNEWKFSHCYPETQEYLLE